MKSEHEKERRAFWDACLKIMLSDSENYTIASALGDADRALAERDKRFPAPESEAT